MEVLATANSIRMSARKVRLVVDSVRGKTAPRAIAQLHMLPRAASRPVRKLIESAVANAEHNFKISKDNLYVKTIQVNQGPMLKRWRARAFGRAAPIAKHSCHILLALAPIQEVGLEQVKKSVATPVEARMEKASVKTEISGEPIPVVDIPVPERAKEAHTNPPVDVRREGRRTPHQVDRKGAGGVVKKIFNRKAG